MTMEVSHKNSVTYTERSVSLEITTVSEGRGTLATDTYRIETDNAVTYLNADEFEALKRIFNALQGRE